MKIIHKFLLPILGVAGLVLMSGCDQSYDPIGNNKPSPLLKISPLQLAFDGTGGELSAEVSTNVEAVEVGAKPDWIESVAMSDDYKTVTVKATANTDPAAFRTGTLSIKTKSGGDNDATQFIRCIQAAQGAKLTFESFSGKRLPEGWKVDGDAASVKVDGTLSVPANTKVVYRMPAALVTQADNRVIATVDVKGGQGGLIAYVNDNPTDAFVFAFSVSPAKTDGFFFAAKKGGTDPMAMDGFPQAGLDPIASAADDWFRIEFSSAVKYPNWWQAQVTVYSLENRNGELKVLGKHYTRQFEIDGPKPQPGYFGVICREGSTKFKDFMLSAK